MHIDIAIENIGIEIKVANSRSKLQRLCTQVEDYKEHFDSVIALIFDTGSVSDIDRYINKIKDIPGVEVITKEYPFEIKERSLTGKFILERK